MSLQPAAHVRRHALRKSCTLPQQMRICQAQRHHLSLRIGLHAGSTSDRHSRCIVRLQRGAHERALCAAACGPPPLTGQQGGAGSCGGADAGARCRLPRLRSHESPCHSLQPVPGWAPALPGPTPQAPTHLVSFLPTSTLMPDLLNHMHSGFTGIVDWTSETHLH